MPIPAKIDRFNFKPIILQFKIAQKNEAHIKKMFVT